MSTNWQAEANFARLGADISTGRKRTNDRDGNLVVVKEIVANMEEYGYDEADICEACAMGFGKTDPSRYTFTILEYLFRYTSKYGALLLIAIGLISTIYLAATKGKELWDNTFGEAAKKGKEAESVKTATKQQDKAYMMGMGSSNVEVATALSLGLLSILPPVTYAAVIRIIPSVVPGFGSAVPTPAVTTPVAPAQGTPVSNNPLAGKMLVRMTSSGMGSIYANPNGTYQVYDHTTGTLGPLCVSAEACDAQFSSANMFRGGLASNNSPVVTAQPYPYPAQNQSSFGRTVSDVKAGVGLLNDLRDLFKSNPEALSLSEQEVVSDIARDIARDSGNSPGSLGIQR